MVGVGEYVGVEVIVAEMVGAVDISPVATPANMAVLVGPVVFFGARP